MSNNLPHRRGSFNYRAINDQIRQILDERSVLDNTTQVAMPFVKATTTLKLPSIFGSSDAIGFTLGIHANQKDFDIQDIYADRSGNGLIGYTYVPDADGNITTRNVYADVPALAEKANRFFDGDEQLYSDGNQFAFIPPPGITNVTVGTNRAGLTRVIQINFAVPTLQQLEILHRTFLVPNAGMILEWGHQFAPKSRQSFGELGINDTTNYFPWYDHDQLVPLLRRLGRKEVGMEEILNNYVYPSQGQYMWLFGRVGGFNTTANADGSFDCSVKLFGQGEESWGYLTRSTMVRPPSRRDTPICLDNANSVESYFTKTSAGKNLKTLLEAMETKDAAVQKGLGDWFGHVKKFNKGNQKEGESTPGETLDPKTSESSFGEAEDAYFMTWRFFVNIVLNDERHGIKSVFVDAALTPEELAKVSLLRPYKNSRGSDTDTYIVDPYENFVGTNKYLRSVDLGTLVIVNEEASVAAFQQLNRVRDGVAQDLHPISEDARAFVQSPDPDNKAMGDFYQSAKFADPGQLVRDKGFLSSGVWLNHKAVVQSFASATTILQGLNNLLNRMNNATLNFWNLTIDASEPDSFEDILEQYREQFGENSTQFTIARENLQNAAQRQIKSDYIIVDVNYKESSDYAVTNFLDRVHVFNKYIRNKDGTLVGSDVIDCSVTLDLPKSLFSQISTLGLVQPKDIAEATGEDQETIDGIVSSPALPGPDELLRQMFAITSVTTAGDYEESPDLTYVKVDRTEIIANSICSSNNSQTTAETGGQGHSTEKQSSGGVMSFLSGLFRREEEKTPEQQLEELTQLLATCDANCRLPEEEQQTTQSEPVPIPDSNYCVHLDEGTNERFVCDRAYESGITDKVELAQFLAQVGHESNSFRAVAENLNYSEEALNRVFSAYFGPGKENAAEYARQPVKIANYVYADENRRSKLGNDQPGDGWKYRGRGYIQLTGKSNYTAFSQATGRDVVANPDYLTTPEGATDSALWFWKNRVRTRNPNFGNTTEVRRIINGGENGLSDTDRRFRIYAIKFNIGREDLTSYGPDLSTPIYSLEGECSNCEKHRADHANLKRQIDVNNEVNRIQEKLDIAVREFPHLRSVFRYYEPFGEWMVASIAGNADGNRSNPFGAAPGTLTIKADITLPGIAGLRVGELFWIDRIPAFYRAFGAFQIMSIEENVSMDGWTTKIHGVFNYLGNQWKQSMKNILAEGIST